MIYYRLYFINMAYPMDIAVYKFKELPASSVFQMWALYGNDDDVMPQDKPDSDLDFYGSEISIIGIRSEFDSGPFDHIERMDYDEYMLHLGDDEEYDEEYDEDDYKCYICRKLYRSCNCDEEKRDYDNDPYNDHFDEFERYGRYDSDDD